MEFNRIVDAKWPRKSGDEKEITIMEPLILILMKTHFAFGAASGYKKEQKECNTMN